MSRTKYILILILLRHNSLFGSLKVLKKLKLILLFSVYKSGLTILSCFQKWQIKSFDSQHLLNVLVSTAYYFLGRGHRRHCLLLYPWVTAARAKTKSSWHEPNQDNRTGTTAKRRRRRPHLGVASDHRCRRRGWSSRRNGCGWRGI